SKLSSKLNGITKAEEIHSVDDDSFAFYSLLTSDQIRTLQEDTFAFIDSEIEQKKCSVEENLNLSDEQIDILSNSSASQLEADNRKRLSIFSRKLRETQLSTVFKTNDTDKSLTFNLLADVEEEVVNEMPVDQQNDVESMPVAVVSAKKAAHKEETIRCICGI